MRSEVTAWDPPRMFVPDGGRLAPRFAAHRGRMDG